MFFYILPYTAMNFLSHYYFDRCAADSYHVLGIVMPDLLKNADKAVVIHPEKLSHTDHQIQSVINGWKKHLQVDRHFHNTEFFTYHSHQLKLALLPALAGSPVKPFFLGHIALELILDNLLLTNRLISADEFYRHLDNCADDTIRKFLTFNGVADTGVFIRFHTEFKRSRYLNTYTDTEQVAYALKRVCMRLWKQPFTAEQEGKLNEVLAAYRLKLQPVFVKVFSDIEQKLTA